MIVTAALIWYDELPDDLEACIRGVATVADRLIAVDGAYARYPNPAIASPPEQIARITQVCAEIGMESIIHTPRRLWAGQVEKRTYLLQQASCGSDWIAVIDTDWIIKGKRDAVRDELAGCPLDVVAVPFYTPPGKRYATQWHRREEKQRVLLPHFFRPLPGIRVERQHWWYSAVKDGRRVWMWHGQPTERPVLPQHSLKAPYEIEHRTLKRDERHVLAGRAFCNDRTMVMAMTGQEDDAPGLPAPVFDYETEPYG